MIEKILFSPIGKSDPINSQHDASWLHCCRHYQPDLTVVYLSAEILPREKEKHFFSKTLEKLSVFIQKPISMDVEERPGMEKPQDFEAFYDDFEAILTKYHQQYPNAQLLVNVSSGTPAMKGCLIHLYHMLPFRIQLIQVLGPHFEMTSKEGNRSTVPDDYDIDIGWETNLDNLEDAENRCHILKDQQQAIRLRIMQLQTLIKNQEYSAALALAEDQDLRNCLPKKLPDFLNAAVCRIQLDLKRTGDLLRGIPFEDGEIIRNNDSDILFKGAEMFQTMRLDIKRKDIASGLRKLTSVLYTLIVGALAKENVDIMAVRDDTGEYLDKSRFQTMYPVIYSAIGNKLFRDPKYPDTAIMDSDRLLSIYNFISPNKTPLKNNIDKLRNIERKARNIIAHKPEKLTGTSFRTSAGCSTGDMMNIIQNTFELLNGTLFNNQYWLSYDRMRDTILKMTAIDKG